jgi:hypothetical protein
MASEKIETTTDDDLTPYIKEIGSNDVEQTSISSPVGFSSRDTLEVRLLEFD